MGTTASAAPPTAPESFNSNGMMDSRQSLSSASFQAVNIHNSKAKSIITNKVAPVVITYNCRQEFQIHDDLPRTHYKVGRIADNMPDHFLVQGSYFMVQDVFSEADVLNTTRSCGAPNFRKCKGSYPVFSMGQPSLTGFKRVLETIQNQGSEEVIFFCVREEPVLFLRLEDDFVPYTPRSAEKLHEQLQGLSKEVSVENLELSIRREIHDFARLNESVFYVYNDIENFKDEPHKISISSEEDILVTEEVYKRPVFTIPAYRYHRLPLPLVGAPREEQFDAFISMLRENSCLSLNRDSSRPLPALLFGCQAGQGRADMGMVLGTLVLQHLVGAPPPPPQSPPPVSPTEPGVTEVVDSEQKVQFQVIQMLVDKLPKGQQVMQEVDRAIELCSEVHNIKEAIYDNKRKLEAIGEDDQTQGSCSKAHLLQRALQDLERYIYLILFNAYLHEQYPLAFARNFSQWMCANAWVFRLLACMNQSELKAPADLVTKGTRVLVSDEYMAPDVLSTMKEMKVANFRRVPKMPVYGMAQPTAEALSVVLAYLRAERRLHKHVLWVSLQAELVLEADGRMFSPREACCLNQPIPLHAAHTRDIQSLETALKEELLRAQKSLDVMLEREKQTKLFKSYHTLLEIFTQQQSLQPGLHYHRIPLPEHGAPREMDFDRLLEVMKSVLDEDPRAALVFSCATGRASTTTAMTSAVLTCWHFSGFPEGGEDEIVSVPDAKYTKGEFEVVMQLVRLLPDGHRMKREVDMALDCVSETMTPMHYHLREIIISTYRQIKSSKSDQERHSLSLRSLRYLERYIYLILFNTYLHLEKRSCWTRPFSTWMQEVAARAGVYDLLNQLGFWEFENQKDSPLARLHARWQEQSRSSVPFRGELI